LILLFARFASVESENAAAANGYPFSQSLFQGTTLSWRIVTKKQKVVGFRLRTRGHVWVSLAVAGGGKSMLHKDIVEGGTGNIVIGFPLDGEVRQYRVSGYAENMFHLVPPEDQTFTAGSVSFDGTFTTLEFERAVNAPGDLPINLNGNTELAFAVGQAPQFAYHGRSGKGFLSVRISTTEDGPVACTRDLSCDGHGSCLDPDEISDGMGGGGALFLTDSSTCLCDVGYRTEDPQTGISCDGCAIGFSIRSATSACVLDKRNSADIGASFLLTLAVESVPRKKNEFAKQLSKELAERLEIPTNRVRVDGMKVDALTAVEVAVANATTMSSSGPLLPLASRVSLMVYVSLLSAKVYDADTALNIVASRLLGLSIDRGSPLYTDSIILKNLRTITPPVFFSTAANLYTHSAALLPAGKNKLKMDWSTDGGFINVRLTFKGFDRWVGWCVQHPERRTMIGGDCVVYEPRKPVGEQFSQVVLMGRTNQDMKSVPITESTLTQTSATIQGGATVVQFQRLLQRGSYAGALDIQDGRGAAEAMLLFALGNVGEQLLAVHALGDAGVARINFETGRYRPTSMAKETIVLLHAMAAMASIPFIFIAMTFARFCRRWITEVWGIHAWLLSHSITVAAGAILILIATVLGFVMVPDGHHQTTSHMRLGLTFALFTVLLQPLGVVFRPFHSRYIPAKVTWSIWWGRLHALIGNVIAILGTTTVLVGASMPALGRDYLVPSVILCVTCAMVYLGMRARQCIRTRAWESMFQADVGEIGWIRRRRRRALSQADRDRQGAVPGDLRAKDSVGADSDAQSGTEMPGPYADPTRIYKLEPMDDLLPYSPAAAPPPSRLAPIKLSPSQRKYPTRAASSRVGGAGAPAYGGLENR
jgi:hypothetical protein